MSDPFEPWPKERLIAPDATFFERALAVVGSAISSLRTPTIILPKPEGPMGSMGPLDQIEGSIKVDPTFKLVFISSLVLTLVVLAASIVLAPFALSNEVTHSVVSNCVKLTNLGFGTLLGLVGGRTTPPPRSSRRSRRSR